MSTYSILNEEKPPYDTIVASVRSEAGAKGETIDVSCTMLGANGTVLDCVSLTNRLSHDGSTQHIDVDLDPAPETYLDTYTVTTKLSQVRGDVTALYYAAHSPAGMKLAAWPPIRSASVCVYLSQELILVPDHRLLPEFAQQQPESSEHHGLVLGAFFRLEESQWLAHEVAATCNSTEQMHALMQRHHQNITQSL